MQPLVFYDIASGPPVTFYAPNPSKARMALNFTGAPYTTQWVELPDIAAVRKSIHAAPVRKFADGTDFYTLPVLVDPNNGSVVGDSFDIAQYLELNYPGSSGSLFPDGVKLNDYRSPFADLPILVPLTAEREAANDKWTEYARFNMHVDATFTIFSQLSAAGMPFNPATAEQTKAEFARRAGVKSWDDIMVHGEARVKLMEQFNVGVETLADMYKRDAARGGPFLLGEMPCYGDFIVGGWLRMFSICLPSEEWEQVKDWWDGVFGKLHDALQRYQEAK